MGQPLYSEGFGCIDSMLHVSIRLTHVILSTECNGRWPQTVAVHPEHTYMYIYALEVHKRTASLAAQWSHRSGFAWFHSSRTLGGHQPEQVWSNEENLELTSIGYYWPLALRLITSPDTHMSIGRSPTGAKMLYGHAETPHERHGILKAKPVL